MSAIAPALSPVASRASARRRINSSFRMMGMGLLIVGHILNPIVEVSDTGPLPFGAPDAGLSPVRIFAV